MIWMKCSSAVKWCIQCYACNQCLHRIYDKQERLLKTQKPQLLASAESVGTRRNHTKRVTAMLLQQQQYYEQI